MKRTRTVDEHKAKSAWASHKIRPTRFQAFGYRQDGPSLWRIYNIMDLDSPAAVGAQYRTKGELLADLKRYAEEYGCELWTR